MYHKNAFNSGPAIIVIAFSRCPFSDMGPAKGTDMVVSQVGPFFFVKTLQYK